MKRPLRRLDQLPIATRLFYAAALWSIALLVLTGLILFLGIGLLISWAYESRLIMPWSDYLIVLAILGSVAVLGMVPSVVLGLVTACVSFVFTLSRSPSIRNNFSLLNRRSNVERSTQQGEILLAQLTIRACTLTSRSQILVL